MSDLSKTFTLAEVEGLLAAERERAVALCDTIEASCRHELERLKPGNVRIAYETRRYTAEVIAAAIRSLPPEPMGGE